MPIAYSPNLAQVLALGNVMDKDITPDAANLRSIGTLLLRLKDVYAQSLRATNGTTQIIINDGAAAGNAHIGTDGTGLAFCTDGLTIGSPRLTMSNSWVQIHRVLLPGTTLIDIGATANPWRDLYLSGSIKRELTDYSAQEYIEHFQGNYNYFSVTGGFNTLYNNIVFEASTTLTNPTASTLGVTTGPLVGNSVNFTHGIFHNPATYTYYQLSCKFMINAVTIQAEMLGLSDYAGDNIAWITLGTNANTIAFNTSPDAGVSTTTTDNISCDLTALHDYTIKIKSGTIKLYYDGVLVATHTTNIFYNVPLGIQWYNYLQTSEAVAKTVTLDYVAVLLGRVF